MTPRHTRTFTAGLVLAAVAMTSACGPGDGEATNTTPPASSTNTTASPTAMPSPTSSPTSESPKQIAVSRAEKAITRYFRARDDAMQDPTSADLTAFKEVAVGSALVTLDNTLSSAKAQKIKQRGYLSIDKMSNPWVDLRNDPKGTPARIPTVRLDICYDVSKVNIVDADGKSVVPATRKPRGIMRVGVGNYEYPEGTWKVAYTEILKDKTC